MTVKVSNKVSEKLSDTPIVMRVRLRCNHDILYKFSDIRNDKFNLLVITFGEINNFNEKCIYYTITQSDKTFIGFAIK